MAASRQAVGIIGLGIIGSRIAARLRNAGYEVWVWNRSPKAEPNFLGSPVEVAETADIILIFVSDGPALIETVKALAPALTARHVVVNHATVGPDEVREAAALAEASSAGFLNAPFTGSRDGAESGEVVYYVGGSPELLERARPVLAASARALLEVGDAAQASLVKIATNLVSAAVVESVAEALALMAANGVALDKFAQALALNASNSRTVEAKLPCMIGGDFDPRFALKHMFKDVQLALDAAHAAGIEMPAASAAAGSLMAGIHKGWADLDFSAVARHYGYPGAAQVDPASLLPPGAANGDSDARPAAPGRKFSIFGGRKKA